MSDGSDETWLCSTCGQAAFTVPVWEDPDAHAAGEDPSFVGCEACGEVTAL